MPLFYAGDELGSIKSVSYTRDPESKQWKPETKILVGDASAGRVKGIQKLALHADEEDALLAAFRADGSSSVLKLDATSSSAAEASQWKENRLREGQRFVGSAFTKTGVYSCTSNGALRLTKFSENYTVPSHELGVLPMRLAEWRLSSTEEVFAYAGDEVELSVWNTEQAFSKEKPATTESESKKRKRTEQLLPGEIWRAKNVPNDELNLRVPVRNTCLTYLQPSSNQSQQHLLVGTQLGDVRRYDTRAARRPVSNFKGVAKVGGIGVVENGTYEHQVFVSDHGCNLFALDMRNGKVSYGYKSLSGAITSLAPSPSLLASAAEDRFLRLHSTFPPPAKAGDQQEQKGEVLDKLYMKVKPTVVLWDGKASAAQDGVAHGEEHAEGDASDDEDDEDVWNKMQDVDSEDESASRKKSKSK